MLLILVSLCGLSCVSQHKHLLVHLSCHSITKTKQGPFRRSPRGAGRAPAVGGLAAAEGSTSAWSRSPSLHASSWSPPCAGGDLRRRRRLQQARVVRDGRVRRGPERDVPHGGMEGDGRVRLGGARWHTTADGLCIFAQRHLLDTRQG